MTKKEAGVGPSSDILARLGLTDEVVESVRAEREAERREKLHRARENGASRYITILNSPEVKPREVFQNCEEVLKIIRVALDMSEEELQECVEAEMSHPIFRAFAEGFGQEALRQGDLEIGITALDLSSENGIMGNQAALDFIVEHTRTPKKRLAAAEIIQKLVLERAGNSPPPRVTV